MRTLLLVLSVLCPVLRAGTWVAPSGPVPSGSTYTVKHTDYNNYYTQIFLYKNGSGPIAAGRPEVTWTGWDSGPQTITFTAQGWNSTYNTYTNLGTRTVTIGNQNQLVSSEDAGIIFGSSFTPAYHGGGGTGAWQFIVAGYTNWPGVNGSGQVVNAGEVANPGTWLGETGPRVTSWTPPAPGVYQFAIRKLGSSGWNESNVAYWYTLTVHGQNGAQFLTQAVPTAVYVNQTFGVSQTWMNSGSKNWGPNHKIGSQNPQDNGTWGAGRYFNFSALPYGSQTTANFSLIAPGTAGLYNFQTRIVEEGVEWFGGYSANVVINVANRPSATIVAGATTLSYGESTAVHADYVADAARGDPIIQTAINIVDSGSEWTVNGLHPGNQSWTFVPTRVGSYTFKAYVQTALVPSWTVLATTQVTVNKANQAITFPNPGTSTYGAAPFELSASATSGLPVSFSVVSGPATLAGNILTINGVGTVTVKASQTGNSNWNAASAIQQSFLVQKATPTITWATPSSITYGTLLSNTQLNATASVAGTFSYSPAGGALLGAGSRTLTATFSPTNSTNYKTATKSVTLTVNKASQTISFPNATAQLSTPLTLSASASSDLPVSFILVSGPATLTGGTLAFSGIGTVKVRATQAGNANYLAAQPVERSFVVEDDVAPSAPFNFIQSDMTETSLILSWSATDQAGVTGYELKFNNGPTEALTTATRAFAGLTTAAVYQVKVRARDAAGNWSAWGETTISTIDSTAPPVPTLLTANAVGETAFTLSWSPSIDNVGTTAYEVRRGTTSLGTVTTVSKGITGLEPGTAYVMTVRARDAAGNWSGWSAPYSVTTNDESSPSVPGSLIVSNRTPTSFTLSWAASTDNVGVVAYEVQRDNTAVLTTSATVASFAGLAAGGAYTVKVRARDAAANWSAWASTNVTTPVIITSAPAWSISQSVAASFSLLTNGSAASYSVVSGSLPPGLTLNTATGVISGTATTPGTFTFSLGVTNAGGTTVQAFTLVVNPATALPDLIGFESSDGFNVGNLANQQHWAVPHGEASVSTVSAQAGVAALALTGGSTRAEIARAFTSTGAETVTFVDMYVRPSARPTVEESTVVDLQAGLVGFTSVAGQAELRVLDGDASGGSGTWRTTGVVRNITSSGTTSDWIRLTARLDFQAKIWDLFVEGQLTSVDLGFVDDALATFSAFRLHGASMGYSYLDSFLVSFENPAFADADKDGLPDSWEGIHGLNPNVSDRSGDLDDDGLTNLEEYLLGTHPMNPDTDGDAIYDGDEIASGTDPKVSNAYWNRFSVEDWTVPEGADFLIIDGDGSVYSVTRSSLSILATQ